MALALRASATASGDVLTLTISKPSGTVQNDVMQCAITDWSGSGVTWTAPTGWSLLSGPSGNDGASQNVGRHVWRKVAGAAEGTSYAFAIGSGTTKCVGEIRSYSGGNTTTPEDAAGSSQFADNPTATATSPAVTTTIDGDIVLRCFGAASYAGPAVESYATPTGYGNATTVNDASADQASQMTCDLLKTAHGTDASQSVTPTPALGTAWGMAGSVWTIAPAAGGATDPFPAGYYVEPRRAMLTLITQ